MTLTAEPAGPRRRRTTPSDASFERHVAAWSQAFEAADAAEADVLHLHHLTPLHEAAARVASKPLGLRTQRSGSTPSSCAARSSPRPRSARPSLAALYHAAHHPPRPR
jgi:hypothetical protein